MDELVKMVAQKTGISEAQASEAVRMVLEFIKTRLPEPIAGQIDGLLAGDSLPQGQGMPNVDDITKGIGDMFGSK